MAKLIDKSGVVRFEGTIENGGAQALPIVVTFQPDWNCSAVLPGPTIAVPNTLAGDGTVNGTPAAAVVTTVPFVYPIGDVIDGNTIVLTSAGVVASTTDALDLSIYGAVSNPAGTNSAHILATAQVASPVTDTAATLDLTAATWTIDAGADLSDGGNGNLVSGAGGVYVVAFACVVVWD